MSQHPPRTLEPELKSFAIEAARLLSDRKMEDIRLLDVIGISSLCDLVLIGSGTSERQMKSVAAELEELAEQQGLPVFRRSRDASTTWVVIDFVNLVVHLFEPNMRAFYDLETLWSDAARIDWQRGPDERPRAGQVVLSDQRGVQEGDGATDGEGA